MDLMVFASANSSNATNIESIQIRFRENDLEPICL